MSTVMLKLGSFAFQTSTATFESLKRAAEYRWEAQERIGARAALQYIGPGPETVTLGGVVYPAEGAGLGQVATLRELAASGEPHLLVAGTGDVLGMWVIESVSETQTVFLAGGLPRRQAFDLKLKKFADE